MCRQGSAGHIHILIQNRTHLKEDFYAVSALTKGRSTNADYEDDIVRILEMESVSDITFFSRVQIGEAVLHSKAYKRVTRRNNYIIAYQKEENIFYGQIEVFFVIRDDIRMVCGAVLLHWQCLVSKSVNRMRFWGALSATLFVSPNQTETDSL